MATREAGAAHGVEVEKEVAGKGVVVAAGEVVAAKEVAVEGESCPRAGLAARSGASRACADVARP